MVECKYTFPKETPLKTPKKSPLLLRMVVVAFAILCGLYIFSICLSQMSITTRIKLLNFQVVDESPSCQSSHRVDQSDIPLLHFLDPKTFSRKECRCNPVRLFAILSMQRSGSGWFETLLNSHINVSSNGEIFSVQARRTNVLMVFEMLDRVYNLDWFTSASKNECSAAVGFKWMLNQGLMDHHKEIVEYFNKKGVSLIFLFRKNLLRRLISVLANSYDKDAKLLNGTHKSHVHSSHEAQILAKYKPTINATLLLPSLKESKETTAKALEYFKTTRHIVVYYEDIVSNQTRLEEVQNFLRLPNRKLSSQQVKIHTSPLSNQIDNWDDVQRVLEGTSFEHFLYMDYHS